MTRTMASLIVTLLMYPATPHSVAAEPVEVINAGIGGHRSTNLLSRLQRDVLKCDPTVVVIMVGTNDRLNSGGFVDAQDFRRNVEQLVERIRAAGSHVLLVTPPTCIPELLFTRHDPRKFDDQSPRERMQEVQQLLTEISRKKKVPLVDFHQHLDENELADNRRGSVIRNVANSGSTDGVHLTPEGYELLAEMIAEKLREERYNTSRVVCFGDSLTRGSDAGSYPSFLASILSGRKHRPVKQNGPR